MLFPKPLGTEPVVGTWLPPESGCSPPWGTVLHAPTGLLVSASSMCLLLEDMVPILSIGFWGTWHRHLAWGTWHGHLAWGTWYGDAVEQGLENENNLESLRSLVVW